DVERLVLRVRKRAGKQCSGDEGEVGGDGSGHGQWTPCGVGVKAVAVLNRVIEKASSETLERPRWISSASASPTAGPVWKPAPQKPNAWISCGVVGLM